MTNVVNGGNISIACFACIVNKPRICPADKIADRTKRTVFCQHKGFDGMTQWKRPYKLYILAILCTILWGSAIPLIKLGYAVFDIAADATADKLLFAGIRFLGAGLIILVP